MLLVGIATVSGALTMMPRAVANGATTASSTTDWGVVPVQGPSGSYSSYSFGSTSCVTASDCLSAGTGVTSTGVEHLFVEHWNGKAWTTMALPSFGQAAAEATTCLSADDCWVVGARFSNDYPTHAVVLHWNGTAWAISPSPSIKTDSALNGIACYTSGCVSVGVECVAAAECFSSGGATWTAAVRPLVERWDGTAWSVSKAVQPPGSFAANLDEVRCSSASHCVSIGLEAVGGPLEPTIGFSEVWDGHSWKVELLPVPPEIDHYSNSVGLNDIACPTASDCIVVGGATPRSGGFAVPAPLIETWNGSKWAIDQVKRSTSGPLTLEDLSCLSSGRCAVVGFADGYIETSNAAAALWNGSKLTLGKVVAGKLTDSELLTVGCAGSYTCVALGYGKSGSKLTLLGEKAALPK